MWLNVLCLVFASLQEFQLHVRGYLQFQGNVKQKIPEKEEYSPFRSILKILKDKIYI